APPARPARFHRTSIDVQTRRHASRLFHLRVTAPPRPTGLNRHDAHAPAAESSMRVLTIAVAILTLSGSFAYAQTDRLYIGGMGGFAAGPDGTSRDTFGEAGVRVA